MQKTIGVCKKVLLKVCALLRSEKGCFVVASQMSKACTSLCKLPFVHSTLDYFYVF